MQDFQRVVTARLRDMHRNQEWLGQEVGRLLGVDPAPRQTTVSNWINGRTTPDASTVFAMERALGLRPGQLSQLMDPPYLPVHARPMGGGVEEAISDDPYLPTNLKRALLSAYREMRADA